MAANMDGVGTFQMANTLSSLGLFTCITKHNNAEDWSRCFKSDTNLTAISIGTNLEEYSKSKKH